MRYKTCHPPNFPKLQTKLNFLSNEECKELSRYIIKHPLIDKSVLSDGFSSSYGFVIRFNEYSKIDFMNSKYNLKKLHDVFEKIKEPGTNAYVCNPLILGKGKSIEYHYDDTLCMYTYFGASILPVCVTVLYLQLPDEFTGGELCVADFEKVVPVVGKKVVFRGDMQHAVKEFTSTENTKRVSLVFEQYNVPEIDLCKATFTIVSGDRGAFIT